MIQNCAKVISTLLIKHLVFKKLNITYQKFRTKIVLTSNNDK